MPKLLGNWGGASARPFLFSSVLIVLVLTGVGYAQGQSCTNPTITSVTPGPWSPGGVTNVMITGTGFTAVPVGYSCSASFVEIIAPTGSVAITKWVVVSSTVARLTVQPAATDPPEAVCVEVGSNVEIGVAPVLPRKLRASRAGAVPEAAGTGGCAGVTVFTNIAQATAYIGTCTVPTITSISPNVWFAGQTYTGVVITGTIFVPAAMSAPTGCLVSGLSKTVPFSPTGVSVNSSTQMTFNWTVPASAVTGAEPGFRS